MDIVAYERMMQRFDAIEQKLMALADKINLTQSKLDNLEAAANRTEMKMSQISDELDTLTAQVAANSSALDGAIVVINGIADRIAAAGVDPARLAALTAELRTKDEQLAAAIVAVPPA